VSTFQGFSDSESFTEIPDTLVNVLLPEIKDPDEIKVILYTIWRLGREPGAPGSLAAADYTEKALGLRPVQVRSGLQKAVKRGILLESKRGGDVLYFLNTPRGRAAARAHAAGTLRSSGGAAREARERRNVFQLYEENIGPLTPLIADALKDAEVTCSADWTAEAIELAVKNNKRNWQYCEAILKRWKEEGRGEKQNRRNAHGYDQRDVEAKIRKFIDG
jgi:DnaD/phage-associated family protein